MASKTILRVCSDIRCMKVRGATNIACTALQVIKGARNKKELTEMIALLMKTRPTEPLMRNGLRYVAYNVQQNFDFKKSLNFWADRYMTMSKFALERIAEIGAKRIVNKARIMTHCHATTVASILAKAKEQYKDFEVYVCETRPRLQGRITAKELAGYGIKVSYIIDSAKQTYINDMDLVLVGADALTAEGNIINKVGTSELAILAREADVDFGVAAELLKFDPITARGHPEPIEERDPGEVWDKPPKGVKVRNPAFDLTKRDLIDFIVTEEGVLSPHNILSTAYEKYPWLRR